jgi:hypothetical protein
MHSSSHEAGGSVNTVFHIAPPECIKIGLQAYM